LDCQVGLYPLKLLLSSIACDPFGGSEGIYGWYVVSALAKEHDCFVITGGDSMPSLQRAQEQGMIPPTLKFRFLGYPKPYHPNRLFARFQSWLRFIMFTKNLLSSAQTWHSQENFDLTQHITYTTWRVASPLWKLGIPFIWGPISGTEIFPKSCYSSLSLQALLFEVLRSTQTWVASRSLSVRRCVRAASFIPVPHMQAHSFLSGLRGTPQGVLLCHNWFFPDSRIADLQSKWLVKEPHRPLRAFAAGNLEGRKGVAIALQAIFLAKKAGVRVEYHVTSRGPELAHLQRLSEKLGLSDQVILGERFPATDFASALSTFDIVLLPSLRDGAGLSIMEAMLAGCVPIVADWCGPAEFVTPDCGFKVAVTNPTNMAIEIARILNELDKDRDLLKTKGKLAEDRIRSNYNEKQFLDFMTDIYKRSSSVNYFSGYPTGHQQLS
jgi:glycosyltransferase involved in cell wall biosynthesis